MYLSRFGVKNYKCLGDVDIPLTPIHVLIGQNDCGKTSLLEAMAAFFATSDRELAQVFPGPWTGRELVRHGSSEAQIELSGKWADYLPKGRPPWQQTEYFRCGLSVSFPSTGNQCVTTNQWIADQAGQRSLSLSAEPQSQTTIHWWRSTTQPPPQSLLRDLQTISGVLMPAHKYALNARQMTLPAVFDSARKFRLDPDGFGLATLLDDILGFDPKIFLDIREEFCQLFPQFRSVRVVTEYAVERHIEFDGLPQSSVRDGKGIYFEMQSGGTVRALHASDGAILLLGLLALAHLPEPPRLLLLEEPENGMYPMRLEQIIKLLKEVVDRTEGVRFPQIILTTHSPYLLSFFGPEEVTLLSRSADAPDAPVRARPLRDAPNIRERMAEDELYLGELWYNFTEKELFGDP